ncbi:MAG: hypothetical protein ACTSV5_02145 [Promethearchaeota archaeon]
MMSSHKATKKQILFKLFIYGMIEIICFNFYVIISGIEGNFNWTVERLTSTTAGMAIQTLMLVSSIIGFIIVIQFIIYILLIFTSSD